MSGRGVEPWHMWGNSSPVQWADNTVSPPGSPNVLSPQLVSVDYGRPENWQFFFAAQPLSGVAAGAGIIIVNYQVTIGLGRASFVIPFFCSFTWNAALWNASVGQNQPVFGSQTSFPQFNAGPQVPVTTIAAQSLRIQAQVAGSGTSPGVTFAALISATVAPSTHLRPEWFLKEFPGGETHGR